MARALVVGTLVGEGSLKSQIKKARSPYVDIVEVRLDTFHSGNPRELLQHVRSQTRKPLMLTLRSHTECGKTVPPKHRWTDQDRIALLTTLLPWARWIDVEIRHLPYAKVMTAAAHRKNVKVIHSYHQFSGRFNASDAARWAQASARIHGDVFKVAMTPHSNEELEDFLSWGQALKNKGRVLIGMGKVGLMSRFIGFSFGSVMTYGHLGRSAAPGQVPADSLGKTIRDLYANAQ